jgi:hypothetical protein
LIIKKDKLNSSDTKSLGSITENTSSSIPIKYLFNLYRPKDDPDAPPALQL